MQSKIANAVMSHRGPNAALDQSFFGLHLQWCRHLSQESQDGSSLHVG